MCANTPYVATDPVDDHHVERAGAVSLILYHRDGVERIPLAANASLVIGRAPPADVVVDDTTMSRAHARLTRRGYLVEIEDLGSTNGTWLGDRRLAGATPIAPGAQVHLGSVVAVVRGGEPRASELCGMLGHDAFCARVEEELRRAQTFGRTFAVLSVHGGSAPMASWAGALQGVVRPLDALGVYGRQVAEAMLLEASKGQARDVAERVLGVAATPLAIGLAVYPDAGTRATVGRCRSVRAWRSGSWRTAGQAMCASSATSSIARSC